MAEEPTVVHFDRRNVWRVAWTVVAVFLILRFLLFVLRDGGGLLGMVVLAWAASLALEPAVGWLSRWVKRGVATLIAMVSLVLGGVIFVALFGGMLADQINLFVRNVPDYVDSLNGLLSEYVDTDRITDLLGGPLDLSAVAGSVAGGVISFAATLVGSVFSVFTFAFFTFYLSADAPRLRRWLAGLFPPAQQRVVATVWDLAVEKTGGYVAARSVLAACSAAATSIFLVAIGMPYWLPLGIWTGVVAQFVPTVGTYIAIALPVFIGLVGDRPIQGVFVLAFSVAYQQVENLLLEPRISAKAVEVHPAIAFGSVILGASLFGVAGAFIAVPTAALIVALMQIYSTRYEVSAELLPEEPERANGKDGKDGGNGKGGKDPKPRGDSEARAGSTDKRRGSESREDSTDD